MQQSILDFLQEFTQAHLYRHIVLIMLAALMILVSMAVDLYFGVKKARELETATSSTGFKKTCEKARKYYSPFIVLVCIDLIGCVIIPVPAFSMMWAAYCAFCEFTSVREKAWKKEELRRAERTMSIVVENKEDIAKLVAQLLTSGALDKPEKPNDVCDE